MHTQEKDDKVQFAVTLTPATTKAEKYKATSGGATERIRRDISYPKLRVVGLRGGGTSHGTHMHRFEGLIGAPGDENSGQGLSITVILL
jgi:hypothetical protein